MSDVADDAISGTRAMLVEAVKLALPGVPVYPNSTDDVQESPCVIFDFATIQRSFQSAGASIIRHSIWVVAYRGAPTDTVPSMDSLTAKVWNAIGGGGSKVLAPWGVSNPQSAVATPLAIGEVEWPAMRVDTDITVSQALCNPPSNQE